MEYSIVEAYSFLTVSAGVISLASNSMADKNAYTATLKAKLTNYPDITAATVEFSVTLVDPCLTSTLALLTILNPTTITSCIGTAET